MLGRNGQRKLGTTRGSPRRSRTAKASPISRSVVKSRCAREWDGWGRLSDDGPRQHNSDQSEDPWGGGPPNLQGGARSSARPDTVRDHRSATRCAKGGHKPNISQCTPGAGLSWTMCGKVPPYTPAFQPYRGEPAVRNDREGRGDVGIIRSPVRASTSTRLRGALSNGCPYRVTAVCCTAYVGFRHEADISRQACACPLSERSGHPVSVWSVPIWRKWPTAVTGRVEIPQRSSLLPFRGVVSFRLEAPEPHAGALPYSELDDKIETPAHANTPEEEPR